MPVVDGRASDELRSPQKAQRCTEDEPGESGSGGLRRIWDFGLAWSQSAISEILGKGYMSQFENICAVENFWGKWLSG